MVNAQTWLNEKYPDNGTATCVNQDDKENYGKKRSEITSLDISNKDLEGSLSFTNFTNLKKLNISYNRKLSGFYYSYSTYYPDYKIVYLPLEEIDASHSLNVVSGPSSFSSLANLRKLNWSDTSSTSLSLNLRDLSHLDVSNNYLSALDLSNSPNLIEVNCANNLGLKNLTTSPGYFTPNFMDCRNTSLKQVPFSNGSTFDCFITSASPTTSTPTSTVTVTNTATKDSGSSLVTALSATTGVFGLYFLVTMGLGGVLMWKKFKTTRG